MKIKIGSILLIFFILLTGCAFPTNGQSPIVPVSGALTVTQVIDKSAAAQSIGQNGQNSQVETCRPDLTQAAAALNITADQLQAALGRPIEGKPDMTAAASKLGVSVDALQTAMRGALPSNCSAPGADKQPASSAAATSPKSQSGQSDQAAACRPDMTRVAATLHITSDQLQSALGSAGQSQPDLTAAATKLGISADTLQTAMQQSIASSCPTKTTANKTEPGPGTFTMDQTLSDKAQEMTIAFDGLAFLTGNLGSDSFFPPGKVADFWGFQYLRDNDPSEMGHNTDFLTRASLNMFTILTAGQKAQLIALAKKQVSSINEYGAKRFVLMTAFRRLLTGDLPAGTTGLNEDAVKTFSAELYQLDGQMSYERAQVMGSILHDLNDSQKAYLAKMVGKGMTSWLDVPEPVELRPTTGDEKIAVMSYAGRQ